MSTAPRRVVKRGRPRRSRSFDASVAEAFGTTIRNARLAAGISQEELAHVSQIERSYLGRLERGQSQPTLFALLKVAAGLGCEGSALVAAVEQLLVS